MYSASAIPIIIPTGNKDGYEYLNQLPEHPPIHNFNDSKPKFNKWICQKDLANGNKTENRFYLRLYAAAAD